jgi:Glycosyl transferases group 1
MVARADQGGIAAQDWSFARRMRPEKVLVVHTEHDTRGRARPEIYGGLCGEMRTTRRAPRRGDAEWLCEDIDVIYTTECFYGQEVPFASTRAGAQTVIAGNPEMTGLGEMCDVMLAPTKWRMDALPGEPRLLPVPTDPELLPLRPAREVNVLYHVASNAMCDRNGTQLLIESLGRIRHELELWIRGGEAGKVEHCGLVTVKWLGHHDGMFFDHWVQDIDALVLPRRYGGLCLPMQEAATLGLPIITLDVEPQRDWLPTASLVPAVVESRENMRGGQFDIHRCDPRRLAGAINQMVEDPATAAYMRERSIAWAESISWDALRDHYDDVFR